MNTNENEFHSGVVVVRMYMARGFYVVISNTTASLTLIKLNAEHVQIYLRCWLLQR